MDETLMAIEEDIDYLSQMVDVMLLARGIDMDKQESE